MKLLNKFYIFLNFYCALDCYGKTKLIERKTQIVTLSEVSILDEYFH